MPTVNEIINIGFSLHQDGKLEEAENAYQEALKLGSENAEVFNLMGVLKLQQNDVEHALEWVTKAIKIHPPKTNGILWTEARFFISCVPNMD